MLRGEIFIWSIWRNIETLESRCEELRWNMDNGVMLCDFVVIYISRFWEVCFYFIFYFDLFGELFRILGYTHFK